MTNKSKKSGSRYGGVKRRKRNAMIRRIIVLLIILVVAGVYAYNEKRAAQYEGIRDGLDSLLMVKIPTGLPHQEVEYSAMKLSFNKDLHIPNYVAWELTRGELEKKVGRNQGFMTDRNVDGCPTVDDYKKSGFDKGHMMPAADAKFDAQAMVETFMLTNICPQASELNQGSWRSLEEKCRIWADADSAIVIVCGPIVNDEMTETIGGTKVAVPKRFFKVILSPYANPPRSIGFIMPNGKVHGGMQMAAVSVNEVERITGYDFFSSLPDDIEEKIEEECRFDFWTKIHR